MILAWIGLCGTVGTLGVGTAAAAAGLGTSLAVPGLGLIVDGPIVFGLAGAGLGAILGGTAGLLMGGFRAGRLSSR